MKSALGATGAAIRLSSFVLSWKHLGCHATNRCQDVPAEPLTAEPKQRRSPQRLPTSRETVSRVTNGCQSSTVIPAQVSRGLPVSVSLTAGDEQKLLLPASIELRASLGLRSLFHPPRHDLVRKEQALPLFLYWQRGCAFIHCWFSTQLWLCSYRPASLAAVTLLRPRPNGNSVSEGPGYVAAAKYRF